MCGTVDVKGVAVLGTLISTLTEEAHHLLWLPTEHQLSSAHYSNPAEHLNTANMHHVILCLLKKFFFFFPVLSDAL